MTFIAEDLAVTTNPDGNRLQTIASRLRKHLQKIAGRRVPTTYQELAKALALTPPHRIHPVTEALEPSHGGGRGDRPPVYRRHRLQ